jgi:hypothetical protein
MSDDNIETKVESTTDSGASDRADSPAERHSDDSRERGESVRETLRQSWKDATGEDPSIGSRPLLAATFGN